jgi:hypothetical protein
LMDLKLVRLSFNSLNTKTKTDLEVWNIKASCCWSACSFNLYCWYWNRVKKITCQFFSKSQSYFHKCKYDNLTHG